MELYLASQESKPISLTLLVEVYAANTGNITGMGNMGYVIVHIVILKNIIAKEANL